MDLAYILETIILGVVSSLISAFIIFVVGKLGGRKLILNNPDKKFKLSSLSLFAIFLFITFFFGVLSIFGFYFQWVNFSYLVVIAIVLGFLTSLIYEKQCPNCHKLFYGKKLVNKETLKEEKRTATYYPETIYFFSDGTTVKDRKYSKEPKTRTETWRTEKEFYECESCGHKWDRIFVRNLDENNKPKPTRITTGTPPPSPFNNL